MEITLKEFIKRLEQSEAPEIERALRDLKKEYRLLLTPWELVQRARTQRPSTKHLIEGITEKFYALHGDRLSSDDESLLGGIGMIAGIPVTLLGTMKGNDLESHQRYNFGMVRPGGYRKAKRLMDQANKFGRPIITLIDTPGAYPDLASERAGQAHAIAENLRAMGSYTVPIIAIIVGEGGSGGALALAVANEVWMYEDAMYSILSPEGFAAILYKDVNQAERAATNMKLTSHDLKELGIIDHIIPEAIEGFNNHEEQNIEALKHQIVTALKYYKELSGDEIRTQRKARFRNIGAVKYEPSYR